MNATNITLYFTNLIKQLILALLLTLFGCQASEAQDQEEKTNPEVTPEMVKAYVNTMSFEDMEGVSHKLSDFRGKIVVLDFWQTWCAPCMRSFKGFQKAKEQWPEHLEILALSPDWSDKSRHIKKFMRKHPYKFTFAWAGELGEQLDLASIPFKIIISPEGELIYAGTGTKGAEGEYNAIEKMIAQYF